MKERLDIINERYNYLCEELLKPEIYNDYKKMQEVSKEKNAIENGVGMDVFIDTNYIPLPYNKSLDVDGAYMHLKTLPKFQNAIDDE